MVERQDIDALLISALYGELTPSEETRLAAHLDSHPGDRTALADLTHARGLVRESRLLQVQLDPPASVSALLMKEATRCAPKPQAQDGWFARFVRSFAAHPAMAAAAMLVVVLGVATLVTKRSGDQFAESTAPASQATIQEKSAAGAPAPGNRIAPSGAMGSGSAAVVAPPADVDALERQKVDTFRVALDEGAAADDNAKDHGNGLADKKSDEKPKRGTVTVTKPSSDADFGGKLAKEQQQELANDRAQLATKKSVSQGIELRAQDPGVKDLEDDSRRKGKVSEAKPSKNEPYRYESTVDGRLASPDASAPGAGAASGGAATTGSSTRRAEEPKVPAPTPTTTATAPRPTTPRANNNASPPAPPPPAVVAKPETRRDAPVKTVDRSTTVRAAGPAEEKPADPQLAWARDQHAALVAQVRAGECKKAAGIATAISNRAPAYYQQNVETDRAVKACIAYINSERERDAEQKAERSRANQKRSVNEPAPAKAAPSKPTASDAAH